MGFFDKMFNKPASKDIARERLKFVLMHDRATLAPGVVEKIKDEIIAVISKYVEIDESVIDVELKNIDAGTSALVANIPILTARNKRTK